MVRSSGKCRLKRQTRLASVIERYGPSWLIDAKWFEGVKGRSRLLPGFLMASKRGSGFAIVLVALTTFAFIVLPSCAPVEQHVTASRAAGTEIFSSVGDVMLRVEVQEDLPNIFGRADIYGRKRDRGFSDIRYMGLTADGLAIFRRRDVDILTNEDTMNRMGFGTATVTAQPAGQGVIATGITTRAPAPNLAVLPPDTTEFTLDLAKARLITLREKSIEILDASPSGIRFVVR